MSVIGMFLTSKATGSERVIVGSPVGRLTKGLKTLHNAADVLDCSYAEKP